MAIAKHMQSQELRASSGSHLGSQFQGFAPSFTALPGQQEAGGEAEQPGHKLATTWDLSMCKVKILATEPSCLPLLVIFVFQEVLIE